MDIVRSRIYNTDQISKNMDHFRKSGGLPHGWTIDMDRVPNESKKKALVSKRKRKRIQSKL